MFAQWVNSYKRLVPGYEAPVYCAWSRRNRSALVRVPLYHPGKEQATRMELRCPDPACNPYLTFAILLAAGLEGIEKGYELPEPMEKNLYHITPEERQRLGIEQLPETLGEAIELTAESELVLRTFGEHIFNRYVEIKRQEWEDYRVQVTAVGARPVPLDPVIFTLASGRRAKWVVFFVWLVGIFIAVGPLQLPTKFADAEDNESTSYLPGDAESTKALTATEEPAGRRARARRSIVY